MTRGTRAQQGERGAAALSLLVVSMVLGLAILAFMAVPLTQASSSKAKSRNAADAAALAAVEHVRDGLLDQLTSLGWLSGGWAALAAALDGGLGQAQQYAARNDATLVAFSPPTPANGWTAYARVRGNEQVEGEWVFSDARAELDLPSCSVQTIEPPEPTPTPTPSPTPTDEDDEDDPEPTPTPTPTPEPDPEQRLTCDGGISFQGLSLGSLPGGVIEALREATATRLVD
jgi:cell division septation protein DedD